MLTQLHRLLCAQIAALGYAVHHADCVPAGADFPYVTLLVEPALTMTEDGSVTLTGWHRSGASHEDRLTMADTLTSLVPAAGLPLWLDSGLAVLYRPRKASVAFTADKGVQGVSVRFDLRLYLNKA